LKRSILFSLLVVGVALTLVTTGGTYSVFTDASTGSAEVDSATLDLLVNGDEDVNVVQSTAADGDGQGASFTFSLAGTDCDLNALYPTIVCTRLITVGNDGDLSFTYSIDAWSDVDNTDDGAAGLAGDTTEDCFDIALDITGGAAPSYATVDTADASSDTDAPAANAYPTTVGDDTDLAAGETMQLRVSAVVDDDNACQTTTGFIMVTIQASQSATPLD
jgi:hypothetical protein